MARRTRLELLAADAADCKACDLWRLGTQTVFGEGPESADVLLVGEQPGDQEDLAGEPFVGPAGRLPDEAMDAAGLRSEEHTSELKSLMPPPYAVCRLTTK